MSARTTSRNVRPLAWLALATFFGTAASAWAAHPFATEDTGTQGRGKFELEFGSQRAHEDENTTAELGAQLSYGLTDALDLIARPTLLDVRNVDPTGEGHARGLGDASFGFKWRAIDTHPVSAGIRADVFAPTGSAARGLGAGGPTYHAVAIVTGAFANWRLHGNIGYNRVPAVAGLRRDLVTSSAAAVWSPTERHHISFEVIASSPAESESDRWSMAARIGFIASLTAWLDVDAGYQTRLNHAGPQSIALAGATFRW